MTIVYCDYTNGDDDTGDGSAGNPYKTITKASTGLTGGDEVRCAKSPAPSSLGGNLTFADGSKSVATSVDMTGSLAAMDFVGLNTAGETWWEISSITSTTITLVRAYSGTGGTGAGYKLGVTDTGTPASYNTNVQTISARGTDNLTKLKISGGWNLSGTPAKDGVTWFWCSAASRDGIGLYASSKFHISIENIGFLRYYRCLYFTSVHYFSISDCTFSGSRTYGIVIDGTGAALTDVVIVANASDGLNWTSGVTLGFENVTLISNGGKGAYFAYCTSLLFDGIVSNRNYIGLHFVSCSDMTFIDVVCNSDTAYAIQLQKSANDVVFYGLAHNKPDYWEGINFTSCENDGKAVIFGESISGGASSDIIRFSGGWIEPNTSEADGGTGKCLKFTPKSDMYYIHQNFQVPVSASTARTVSIKMKDNASFNGSVYLELWYRGVCIVGPTEKTMTTSYAAQEMTATSGMIAADGVLTLKIKVYGNISGSAGAVYADTLTYS